MPNFHKLQRGIYLALFASSAAYSFYNPHVTKTVALSLIGLIAYDIVCYFKGKSEVRDFSPELEMLKAQQAENAQHIKEMKNDVGAAKLAATFRKG